MTDAVPLAPPAWVHKRDGRLVPFEADKISRALFAATESLGQPDAFLARELADGVVHFLVAESEDGTPTTAQIAELVTKVVRELGQPALAERFAATGLQRTRRKPTATAEATAPAAARGPAQEVVLRFTGGTPLADVLAACTRAYSLQSVFTRDLVAAQGDGLLTLTGLDIPGELAGCVLGPQTGNGDKSMVAALEEVRRYVGRWVALDSPEYLLTGRGRTGEREVADFARNLVLGLHVTGLEAVVNLNGGSPPSWADDLAGGPLFAGHRRAPRGEDLAAVADLLCRALLAEGAGRVRIDWHLNERDFLAPARERLLRQARAALDGSPLAFVFDRPRRAVALAEGVDRRHPAVLLTVGLHLPRLARLAGMEDPERFLLRLGSLARLALSAGVQKRDFVRRQERNRPESSSDAPGVTSGFLLDRARLVVAVVGLDRVVQTYTRRGLCTGGAGLDFGRRVVLRLRDVLRQDGRITHLDTCLDGPFGFRLDAAGSSAEEDVAGLTPWDAAAPVKGQLRAGGSLHAAAEGGTLALFVPADNPPAAEQVAEWLQTAWQHSDVVRLRLLHVGAPHRQLTFGG